MKFLMIEGQDSTCTRLNLPLKHMACHAHTQEISGHRQHN